MNKEKPSSLETKKVSLDLNRQEIAWLKEVLYGAKSSVESSRIALNAENSEVRGDSLVAHTAGLDAKLSVIGKLERALQ